MTSRGQCPRGVLVNVSPPPSGNLVSSPVGGRPVGGGGGMNCAAPGPALALDATACEKAKKSQSIV